MTPLDAMRRLLANTDRLNDLAGAVDRLATNVGDKLARLQEASDNQSADLNERLQRSSACSDSITRSAAAGSRQSNKRA